MIFGAVPPRIYVATQPVDFRKGLDGLAAVAKEVLKLDPFSGVAFIFRAKRADATLKASRKKPRSVNRGALPAHLPREEIVIEPEDKACPCCGNAMHVMGEDCSERLDVIPAQFKVIVTRRPKYACRACEEAVVQAPAPARLIEGGIPTEGLIAHVLVSKYADHCPLYRQAQIYARQGIELDRSTLADWVGRAAALLAPVQARLFEILKSSPKLFADETRAPVLDPGRKKVKLGQLWAYARDDRPHVFACEDVQLKCTDAQARL